MNILKQNISDNNKLENKSQNLDDLVLPKIKRYPIKYTQQKSISADDALRDVRCLVPNTHSKLTQELHGNSTLYGAGKQWQVEITSSCHIDSAAFLACHTNRGFTSFAVHIAGEEFWFDQYDNALAFLTEADVNRIDDIANK